MDKLKIGFIGTGKKQKPSSRGYAMAYRHADGYASLEPCEMVACADIAPENGEAFAETYGIRKTYLDYHDMLEKEDLDMVSICVWPHLHAQMTIDCAEAGVRAIHCEKPMASNWADSKRMAQVCEDRGVQLTFNHQRRFARPFQQARKLLIVGEIGELTRLEGEIGNIYDGGTHFIDLFGFFNEESPGEWVIGQADCRSENRAFGALVENFGVFYWQYQNGVHALMVSGQGNLGIGAANRLIGTEGVIEVGVKGGSALRIKREGTWEDIDCDGEGIHGAHFIGRALEDTVDALQAGHEPELSARKALNTTEIIFAAYESCRRRIRIDLPLDEIPDNPLESLFDEGVYSAD